MAATLPILVPIASSLLLLFFITCYKLSTKLKPISPVHDIEQPKLSKLAIRCFSSSEIDPITSTLTPSHIIGHGGSSTVYSATLINAVALKIHHSSHRHHQAFLRELHILLLISHPHIVRILGYCNDKPEQGILVFEYIPKGTLHNTLHHSASRTFLSWSQRISIAFSLAVTLDYLHEGSKLQIIHGDIKSANVLLDENFSPKLCDFGSARMGFSGTVFWSKDKQMMGSPGYVDPHYIRTGLVSKKSDVYSFGVLVLELVTGMEAFCEEEQRLLTAVMRRGVEEIGGKFVDPRLGGGYDEEEVRVMVEIAERCIGECPVQRPSMGEVVRIMREKFKWLSIGSKL